jgi:hypothetical protein
MEASVPTRLSARKATSFPAGVAWIAEGEAASFDHHGSRGVERYSEFIRFDGAGDSQFRRWRFWRWAVYLARSM